MTICDLWEVAVVAFPFTDKAGYKPRPAVALSKRAFNIAHAHTLFAMITTAQDTAWPSDVAIKALASTGLSTPSVVRMKCFTLDNRLISKTVGALAPADAARIRAALATHFWEESERKQRH